MTIYHVEMTCCGWCELHHLLSCLPPATSRLFSPEQLLLLLTAHRRIRSFVFERGLACGQRRYALLSQDEIQALKHLCALMEDVFLAYLQCAEATPRLAEKYEHLTTIVLALGRAQTYREFLEKQREA